MSEFDLIKRNRGAYSSPFSGVGTEYLALGVLPDHSGFVLHETGYLADNYRWDFANVLSPFWRLHYNFSRGHKVIFSSFEKEITPEHIMLIPDNQLFHSTGHVSVPTFWMTFSVAMRLDPGQPIPILLKPRRTELALIKEMVGYYNDEAECRDRKRVFHLSLALLNVLLFRPGITWQEAGSASIAGAVRRIEDSYASKISIPALSREAGMSVAAFTRAFKRFRGVPPVRYVMQVRIRQAADMLVNTPASLDEIAERTGFPNRAYFSRVFDKITGESPARFRRKHSGVKQEPRHVAEPALLPGRATVATRHTHTLLPRHGTSLAFTL